MARRGPKTTYALDKLGGLFRAVDQVQTHNAVAKDALKDARQFLYGPLGADDELDDGDREALIEIARRGVRVHSALLEALGGAADGETDHRTDFDSDEESDRESGLQAPGSNAKKASGDSAMAQDARRGAARLCDVDAIFGSQQSPAAVEHASDSATHDTAVLSPWGL